jgi:hypothetical protein
VSILSTPLERSNLALSAEFFGTRLPPATGRPGQKAEPSKIQSNTETAGNEKKRRQKNIHAKKISARFFNKAPDVASAITDIKEDFSARERYFRSFAAR